MDITLFILQFATGDRYVTKWYVLHAYLWNMVPGGLWMENGKRYGSMKVLFT